MKKIKFFFKLRNHIDWVAYDFIQNITVVFELPKKSHNLYKCLLSR